MNANNLGSAIKRNREFLNLTQEKFAELIGVNPHYIYELERGLKLPSLPVLIKISQILHTGIDNLLAENQDSLNSSDNELNSIIHNLTPSQKATLAKIIKQLLPYLNL